jgi:hypothetical protein
MSNTKCSRSSAAMRMLGKIESKFEQRLSRSKTPETPEGTKPVSSGRISSGRIGKVIFAK